MTLDTLILALESLFLGAVLLFGAVVGFIFVSEKIERWFH
jgi:hypothetical protein